MSFYKLKSLQTLILSGCSKFDNLADELGEMESLTTFLADNTAIRQVPRTIVQLKNLTCLWLCGCKGSPSKSLPSLLWSWISPRKSPKSVNLLPASLQGLNALRKLSLRDCNLSDDAIPKDLGSLYSLESLNLENNHFRSLPSSLGGLSKLRRLILDNCTKLRSIPDLPPDLKYLEVNNCNKLVEIPVLEKLFKSIWEIQLAGCSNLTNTFKQSIIKVLSFSLSLSLSKYVFISKYCLYTSCF
jgi:Leucine-rich repeat (LRR) protein